MPENNVPAAPTPLDYSVTLSDGRVVTMREITGLDEWDVDQMFAKAKLEPRGFGGLIYAKTLAMAAIESVDGTRFDSPTSIEDAKMRSASFKGKDMAKILKLYGRVNGDTDDDEGKDAS